MREPPVHGLFPENAVDQLPVQDVVAVLMEDNFGRHTGFGKCLHHQVRLLRGDIEIIEPLHNQGRAANVFIVIGIIRLCPDGGIIAIGGILIPGNLPEPGAVVFVRHRPVVIQEGSAAVVDGE